MIAEADPTRTATLRRVLGRRFRGALSKFRQRLLRLLESFYTTLTNNSDRLSDWKRRLLALADETLLAKNAHGEYWFQDLLNQARRSGVSRAFDMVNRGVASQRWRFASLVSKTSESINQLSESTLKLAESVRASVQTILTQTLQAISSNYKTDASTKISEAVDSQVSKLEAVSEYFVVESFTSGQVEGFKELGFNEVVMIFETAGDGKVCKRCASKGGRSYTLQETKGVIPVHPRCRCIWRPNIKINTSSE